MKIYIIFLIITGILIINTSCKFKEYYCVDIAGNVYGHFMARTDKQANKRKDQACNSKDAIIKRK